MIYKITTKGYKTSQIRNSFIDLAIKMGLYTKQSKRNLYKLSGYWRALHRGIVERRF